MLVIMITWKNMIHSLLPFSYIFNRLPLAFGPVNCGISHVKKSQTFFSFFQLKKTVHFLGINQFRSRPKPTYSVGCASKIHILDSTSNRLYLFYFTNFF